MPEAPEVQLVQNQLRRLVEGKQVTASRTLHFRFVRPPIGDVVSRVWRHGKWIMLRLAVDRVMAINLGMSGRFVIGRGPKHTRWSIKLDDGTTIHYVDPRCMGRLKIITGADAAQVASLRSPTVGSWAVGLGPDWMSRFMTSGPLEQRIKVIREALSAPLPIKRVLMNQARLAGLGNIYAAEACWHAKVNPERPADSITKAEATRLAEKVPVMLSNAVRNGGTSLGDANSYVDLHGVEGVNSTRLAVYGRAGKPCARCGTKVEKFKQGGRTTFYCPNCQK